MKRYVCHKEVHADIIRSIEKNSDGEGCLFLGNTPFTYVSAEYMRKHEPHVGGYYVVYEDGYKSFSPAAAFEKGYTEWQPTKSA